MTRKEKQMAGFVSIIAGAVFIVNLVRHLLALHDLGIFGKAGIMEAILIVVGTLFICWWGGGGSGGRGEDKHVDVPYTNNPEGRKTIGILWLLAIPAVLILLFG